MKNKILIIVVLMIFLLSSCSTVPMRMPQPWHRISNSSTPIIEGASMNIIVSGVTKPLLGKETLSEQQLKDKLGLLLKRRGFKIDNTPTALIVKLTYQSDRNDKMSISSNNKQLTVTDVLNASAMGVNIAQSVNAMSATAITSNTIAVAQATTYNHTISIEIENTDKTVIWKGESTWESENLDLTSQIIPVYQIILSNLPCDKSIVKEVAEIKESHANNYYQLYYFDRWTACPALPSKIFLSKPLANKTNNIYEIPPDFIGDKSAMVAYLDLAQTAEFALPDGDEDDWKKNPLKASLWSKVTLGSKYLIGKERKPVNVVIKLQGESAGYTVNEYKIVSDAEFEKFNGEMEKWKNVLTDFYDMYK